MKVPFCVKKAVAWLPAILVVLAIYVLTCQSPEQTSYLSMGVQEAVASAVSNAGIERKTVVKQWWYNYTNFRRLAHIVEYLVLGISVGIPVNSNKRNPILSGLLICFIVSLSDQILKEILPTREFDFKDLFIDFVGYTIGVLTVTLLKRCLTVMTRKK